MRLRESSVPRKSMKRLKRSRPYETLTQTFRVPRVYKIYEWMVGGGGYSCNAFFYMIFELTSKMYMYNVIQYTDTIISREQSPDVNDVAYLFGMIKDNMAVSSGVYESVSV